MLETDIAKKCTATLIGVALFVGASVLVSWQMSTPKAQVRATPRPQSAAAIRPDPESASPAVAPAPPRAAVPADSPAEGLAGDWLERKAFQLELENARLRSRLDDMLNWILDNVRGTFPLPEEQMALVRLDPVDENLAASADLVKLLRLNNEEADRLDSVFMGTRSVLQELEAENISVEQPSETQVVLNIPPYAEAGQLVRDELYGELKRTLGPARFDRFLQVAALSLDEKFEYFGLADRTLEFEELQDADSGDPQLFVRDERVLPSRDNPLGLDVIASEQIVTELPEAYYAYWNWLPDVVTRFGWRN